jgi:hypothetical protein
MTTHISKMLGGPAKSMADVGSTEAPVPTPHGDGVVRIHFELEHAWAIFFRGERLDMVYGTQDEAHEILCQLQGVQVPETMEKRLREFRLRRAEMFGGLS